MSPNSNGTNPCNFLKYADPKFIPAIKLYGNTYNSVTVGWSEESPEFFHRYSVLVKGKDGVEVSNEFKENPYMIENLVPGTSYIIKVNSEYLRRKLQLHLLRVSSTFFFVNR